ncbi:unnamed protein product [Cylindrotheca closterium]|uniref:Uncharacterized protein n=1 Tax=Cylindrotheca closterium TaxID=2856 RepID=A0AAD2GCY6_9STRA|nr:unnamed protein product [Cylindrotheca closterium]
MSANWSSMTGSNHNMSISSMLTLDSIDEDEDLADIDIIQFPPNYEMFPQPQQESSFFHDVNHSSGDIESGSSRSSDQSKQSKRSRGRKSTSGSGSSKSLRRINRCRSSRNLESGASSVSPTTKHTYTKEEIEKQAMDLDEALILAAYAEKAALRIQTVFRERQQQKQSGKDDSTTETDDEKDELTSDDEVGEEPSPDWYMMILLATIACFTDLPNWINKIWGWLKRIFGGDDSVNATDMQAMTNGTPGPGGNGGGGGGGGEAMASQAAASASGAAGSGATAGVAAGAAASSAVATAASAGAAAAGAGAAQVATVVAVSTAAVAATTSIVVSPTMESILSACGLPNPDI